MSTPDVGVVTGLAAEARLAGRLGLVMAGGGTTAGAAGAAAALQARGVRCLVSFGLAGGLDPGLRSGTLVVPEAVIDSGTRFVTDVHLRARLGGASHALVAGSQRALASAAEKRRLWQDTGACAVDMESGAVARAGLRFAVLRAVCDPADSDLPPAALFALDQAGVISLLRLLRSLASGPGQLPALLRLAGDAARARRALIGRVDDIALRGGVVA